MLTNANIIIDFKPVSPECGDLFRGRDPIEHAKRLEKAGVLGLSVVTEGEHFGGSLDLLRSLTRAVSLPILRKDFIRTENDLLVTRDCGAAGVLLIASTVPDLGALYEKAWSIGLKPLVEVHTAEEMELAKQIGASIIGINNRDILRLEKDDGTVSLTAELIARAPKNAFIVSESGIRGREDARIAINSGANAVLVGTAYWTGDFTITTEEEQE
jgi:indole-3-glycerol phosphate synthase